MNRYSFKVLIGDKRDTRNQGIAVRADNIIDAIKKMEEIVLSKEDSFILSLAIGGRIIEVEKEE